MIRVKFNFNDTIKVKLTEVGVSILKQQHDELNGYIQERGGKGLGPYEVKVDEEGYSSFQFWSLIETFGEHVGVTKEQPFQADIILCSAWEPFTVEMDKEFAETRNRIEEGRKRMEGRERKFI